MAMRGLMAQGVPPFPKWLIFVKVAIILLSLIILALAAYALSLYNDYTYYYSSGVPGYLIFLAVKNCIVYGIMLVLELKTSRFYYRIIALVVYIVSCIFWLSGWAWSASWAAYILASYDASYFDSTWRTFGSVMAACAGLGALIWILCIVNLIAFIVACTRSPDSTPAGNVELLQSQKHNQAQQQYVAPQQYAPQQQEQQQQQPHPQQTYATQ